jgi:hypothetical protein
MAFTALQFNANALYQTVIQNGHGFAIGTIVRYNGAAWVRAQADNLADSESVGMVSFIYDVNTFAITQAGFLSGLTTGPYTPGFLYYLDTAVAGNIVTLRPSTVGQAIVPLFIAFTATSGFFFNNGAQLVLPGALFAWHVITADQTLAVNNGYFVNGLGSLDLLLPPVASPGDTIIVWDIGGNGFTITQGAGQVVLLGSLSTTVGVTGSIVSVTQGNKLELINTIANTNFVGDPEVGTFLGT